ncbi:MAG: malonyl-ACP O-methyltransferase BioC [Marinobacterium sp.]|nr:malonyl-ACP O-methyltransferase BioC [Marinobacterium sp.]
MSATGLIDKARVADSFSRCAASYDSVAQLQRDIGHQLMVMMPADRAQSRLLDLGSGTGYFAGQLRKIYPQTRLHCLDLAQGMLAYARETRPVDNAHWLCGDAEHLPLASNSMDLLFSSLVIQWCEQPNQLFSEIARTLKPGGEAFIATLGPQTLHELRTAWAAVDNYTHVNHFLPLPSLQQAVADAGLVEVTVNTDYQLLCYPQLRELTHELKHLGAHNMNRGQPAGLTGRARIKALKAAYEQFRDQEGLLPATYQVYYLCLKKPDLQ